MSVATWSTTDALNVVSGGVSGSGGSDIDEGCAPSGINNAIRHIMAQIATFRTAGTFTSLVPTANDSGALGASGTAWSDLFLASGGVINWDAGDVTITHSGNTLAFAGAVVGYTFDSTLTATTLTCTGAFTSLGIDDNATAERLQIADTVITVGSATAASAYAVDRAVGTGYLEVHGGTAASGTDATLFLYGGTHGTKAGDTELWSNGAAVYVYDLSAVQHQFTGAAYISAATRFAQNTTNTPGNGNNTVGAAVNSDGVLYASAAAPHTFNRTTDAAVVQYASGGTVQGSVSISGATTSYNPFFGSHWSQLADKSQPEIWRGTVCETIDELSEFEERIGDRLPKFKISDTHRSEGVYGVFHTWDSEVKGRAEIGALGAYFVRVAPGFNVQRGDLLESNGDGCARVQSDGIFRASTIAKVTAAVTVETYPDGSYLVPCTLHCG